MCALKNKNKYRFSFTAASLLLKELISFGKMMLEDNISLEDLNPEMMHRERAKTNKREFAELYLRLQAIDKPMLEKLVYGSQDDQKQVAIIAFARTYRYFREFMEEVVQEKVTLFDFKITERDYNSFVSRKTIDHEELELLADSTKAKIKQVILTVLHQAGLIDNIKDRNIIVPIVDRKLEKVIAETDPNDLKLLLYTDQKILNR
jgi:hypothetical protein